MIKNKNLDLTICGKTKNIGKATRTYLTIPTVDENRGNSTTVKE